MSYDNLTPPPGAPPSPGRVTRVLLQLLTRPARVAAVEELSPTFRLIELAGEALKNVAWAPGQKIQVTMSTGLKNRTYTPLSWDAVTGRMRLLAFLHGGGPGSQWAADLCRGDACHFMGPRRSLDPPGGRSRLIMFGDETSFGVAAALRESRRPDDVVCVFEASDVAQSHAALRAIGLDGVTLVQRRADDAHLAELGAEITGHSGEDLHFVLTGKASSIQYVNRLLKSRELSPKMITAKAYWAPGKTGMD